MSEKNEGLLKKRILGQVKTFCVHESTMVNGEIEQKIHPSSRHLDWNEIERVLDEAKQEYLSIPQKALAAQKRNFIGALADIEKVFLVEWFEKYFGSEAEKK